MSVWDEDLFFMKQESKKTEEIAERTTIRNKLFIKKLEGYSSITTERYPIIKIFFGYLSELGMKNSEIISKANEVIASKKEKLIFTEIMKNLVREEDQILNILCKKDF